MPIKRYRTLDEAEIDLICPKPDAQYFLRLARLLNRRAEGSPGRRHRGIFRYRTLEEAEQEAEEWLLEAAMQKRNCPDTRDSDPLDA